MKRFWIIAVIAGLAYIAWSAFHFYTRPKAGEVAPSFVLNDLSGNQVRFSGEDGSPVVIHFWATWCGQCIKELPSLNSFYENYRDKNFRILTISVDDEQDRQAVEAIMENMGYGFPVLLDSKGEVADLYKNVGVPESVIVDSSGVIFERFVGAIDWNSKQLRNIIDSLFSDSGGEDVSGDQGTQGR